MGLIRSATTLLFATNIATGLVCASLASPKSGEVMAFLPDFVKTLLAQQIKVWETIIGRPIGMDVFMAFLAACKILGALAFMGLFGRTLDRLALPCWTIYFCGATYTCYAVGEPVGPCLIFLVALLVRSVCDDSPSQSTVPVPAGKKKR
mmetsp:Transcript_1640/g.3181  ORF Transcript_1640/g.3181 Transcript_1640/m.3181 type:complete len:149 (-) Transcript_1640:72-518(-)